VLEVLDTASAGVPTPDFGPALTEVYVWQGFMDLPTTDGDVDCDKTKTVVVTRPGIEPCDAAGGDAFCDDGNECTVNTCDTSSGTVVCDAANVPNGTVCTSAPAPAVCIGGVCDAGGPCDGPDPGSACNDSNPCTADVCDPTGNGGAVCPDNGACCSFPNDDSLTCNFCLTGNCICSFGLRLIDATLTGTCGAGGTVVVNSGISLPLPAQTMPCTAGAVGSTVAICPTGQIPLNITLLAPPPPPAYTETYVGVSVGGGSIQVAFACNTSSDAQPTTSVSCTAPNPGGECAALAPGNVGETPFPVSDCDFTGGPPNPPQDCGGGPGSCFGTCTTVGVGVDPAAVCATFTVD
jgi:hypothetical protein